MHYIFSSLRMGILCRITLGSRWLNKQKRMWHWQSHPVFFFSSENFSKVWSVNFFAIKQFCYCTINFLHNFLPLWRAELQILLSDKKLPVLAKGIYMWIFFLEKVLLKNKWSFNVWIGQLAETKVTKIAVSGKKHAADLFTHFMWITDFKALHIQSLFPVLALVCIKNSVVGP